VFAAVTALDFIGAWYTRAVATRHAVPAGLCAAVLVGVGALVTVAYVDNHWLALPAALGAFVGTCAGTWRLR